MVTLWHSQMKIQLLGGAAIMRSPRTWTDSFGKTVSELKNIKAVFPSRDA